MFNEIVFFLSELIVNRILIVRIVINKICLINYYFYYYYYYYYYYHLCYIFNLLFIFKPSPKFSSLTAV